MKTIIPLIPFVLGALINMGLGALWYSNVLFAKSWMAESGVTSEQIESTDGMGKVYGLTMLTAVSTSFVIGLLVTKLGIDSVLHATLFAVILWIGTNLPSVIKRWGFENQSFKLGLINHGYDLTVYLIVSVLYAIMS